MTSVFSRYASRLTSLVLPAAVPAVAMLALAHGAAMADDSVRLYAAGSLKAALSSAIGMFQGQTVASEFGPSGLLRERIEKGETAHVFASADMTHPKVLADKGLTEGPPRVFIRNAMCLLMRKDVPNPGRSALELMLDPALKLGVSTPKADPAGDYALEVFAKAETVKAGSDSALRVKALQLSGGPASAKPPEGRNTYGWLLSSGQADIYLSYCSNGLAAARDRPDVTMMPLPADLSTKASYGIVVLKGAPPAATKLVDFLLSPAGQNVLSFGFGFEPAAP